MGYTIRLAPSTPSASDVTKYSFTGPGDSPSVTLGDAGNVVERSVGLVGGATITKRATLDTWSYPNIHGDIMLTTDGAGGNNAYFGNDAFGNPIAGNAWGQPYGTTPDNSAGDLDYGWLGAQKRGYEHAPGISIIEMGARQYSPVLGRFLEVDPVESGLDTNDYAYVKDPVNEFDLDGNGFCAAGHNPKKGKKHGGCRGGSGARRVGHVARAARNAGTTAAAVGWAYANSGSCRMRSGLMVACTGMRWGYGLRGGFTVGNTFMTGARRASPGLMRHEAGHATQWAVFGERFPLYYGADYVIARGNPCRQAFERAAGPGGGYRC